MISLNDFLIFLNYSVEVIVCKVDDILPGKRGETSLRRYIRIWTETDDMRHRMPC